MYLLYHGKLLTDKKKEKKKKEDKEIKKRKKKEGKRKKGKKRKKKGGGKRDFGAPWFRKCPKAHWGYDNRHRPLNSFRSKSSRGWLDICWNIGYGLID